MARANRHHLPGYVWHITHRCHKREFLLKFDKDKKIWMDWLFEAKKRYGLSILNYVVTSNHIHLLVFDGKENVIPKSIQLIAGRTGREYNQRKKRKGAFREDRYHATAVETGRHLVQCIVYIDLNLVRAQAIQHPAAWAYGGYTEIQNPKQRYTLINRKKLIELLGMKNDEQLKISHSKWVESTLKARSNTREAKWTESIAVGDREFVMQTQAKLGEKAIGRKAIGGNDVFELRESQSPYNSLFDPKKHSLRHDNSCFWNCYQ
jgi:REP element-mobilizing transposase RayT